MDLSKESFLYWIHCNRCFEIYIKKQRQILLLSCQHISCEKCVKKLDDAKDTYNCPICKNKLTGRLLGNNLPPNIKELFHPHPWLDGLPTSHIMRFQQQHRTHFEKGMQRLARERERLEQINSQLRDSARGKFEELENIRFERKKLEKRVRKINKQRKEIEAERASRQAELNNRAASTISSEVVTTDSGIAANASVQPKRYLSQGTSIRPRSALCVNVTRFPNPNQFSFQNFAFRDTANFSL